MPPICICLSPLLFSILWFQAVLRLALFWEPPQTGAPSPPTQEIRRRPGPHNVHELCMQTSVGLNIMHLKENESCVKSKNQTHLQLPGLDFSYPWRSQSLANVVDTLPRSVRMFSIIFGYFGSFCEIEGSHEVPSYPDDETDRSMAPGVF